MVFHSCFSSTNAYMLQYRLVDPARNKGKHSIFYLFFICELRHFLQNFISEFFSAVCFDEIAFSFDIELFNVSCLAVFIDCPNYFGEFGINFCCRFYGRSRFFCSSERRARKYQQERGRGTTTTRTWQKYLQGMFANPF